MEASAIQQLIDTGYDFGPAPDLADPDYQAGYKAGQSNANFGKLSDTQPTPDGWQFKPRGTSRQWSHGHRQAMFDRGLSAIGLSTQS